ncbi:hypothetical protein GCM10009412_33520 [Aeromonas salmonicida subsp. achromogenes]
MNCTAEPSIIEIPRYGQLKVEDKLIAFQAALLPKSASKS